MSGEQDMVGVALAVLQSGDRFSRHTEFMTAYLLDGAPAERTRRARAFLCERDCRRALEALSLAEDAVSAVLTGDDGLLKQKLSCVVLLAVGYPMAIELAALRMRQLAGNELFEMHVSGCHRRRMLACQMQEFVVRHILWATPPNSEG